MGSRAFGELLLRPSTFTRIAPARPALRWPARCLSNTSPATAASPAQTPETATTPEVAASSPAQSSQNAANAAIDSLFGAPSSDPAQPAASRTNRLFGENFSPRAPRGRRSPPGLAFEQMIDSESIQNPGLSNKSTTSLEVQQKATFENYPRLNPEYGRTVNLDPSRGRDIVRGIGMLGSLMARNKVKADFNKQRFHERGGLKRKRLNSQRWRARFKTGFQTVTGRVMELTRKGW